VEFGSSEDAAKALDELNGSDNSGRVLQIKHARLS